MKLQITAENGYTEGKFWKLFWLFSDSFGHILGLIYMISVRLQSVSVALLDVMSGVCDLGSFSPIFEKFWALLSQCKALQYFRHSFTPFPSDSTHSVWSYVMKC